MSLPIRPYHTILLAPPAPASVSTSMVYASSPDEILRAFSRQTAHLQHMLQRLLDAQSDALLAGFAPPPSPARISTAPPPAPSSSSSPPPRYHDDPRDETSTAASRSPRPTPPPSVYSPSRSPAPASRRAKQPARSRQPPPPQRMSLRAVREGIRTTLEELADVKKREKVLLAEQIAAGAEAVEGIDALRDKKARIVAKIGELEGEAGGREVLHLAALEERELERDVVRLEAELAERRARLTRTRERRKSLESRREAGLASWKGALREVEGVMRTELMMRDVKTTGWFGKSTTRKPVDVDVVRDGVQGDVSALEARREAVDREKEACEQGARAWEECTHAVGMVEKRLRQHIRRTTASAASSTTASSAISSPTLRPNTHPIAEPTDSMLPVFDAAITTLEGLLAMAEAKEWKPLVCSIGAELAALREARAMFQETVSQTASFVTALDLRPSMLLEQSMRVGTDGDANLRAREVENEEKLDEDSTETSSRAVEPSEDEDDEPGPELLISRLDGE